MADQVVQVVTNNVVTNVIVVAGHVEISADGKTLVGLPGGDFVIPADETTAFFMMQDGAGIGWTYDADTGALIAPPPIEPPPGGIVFPPEMQRAWK
jgi:hypothetical protein